MCLGSKDKRHHSSYVFCFRLIIIDRLHNTVDFVALLSVGCRGRPRILRTKCLKSGFMVVTTLREVLKACKCVVKKSARRIRCRCPPSKVIKRCDSVAKNIIVKRISYSLKRGSCRKDLEIFKKNIGKTFLRCSGKFLSAVYMTLRIS